MLCNANPRNKENNNSKEERSQKYRKMKYKDHVRKTQLDRAFCIQNFLDATFTLELLSILE